MRICYIFTNFHLTNSTGQPGIVYRLAQEMARREEEVFILSNSLTESRLEQAGIDIFLIKGLGDFSTYLFNFFKIVKRLKKIKPDVIHVHGYLLTIFVFFTNKFIKARLFSSLCETPEVVDNFYRSAAITALKKSERVFVTSEYIKNKLFKNGISAEKILVARIGLDQRFLTERKPLLEEFDILYFGDSTKERGFDIIFELANKLRELRFLVLIRWKGENCRNELKAMEKMPNVIILYYPYKEKLEDFILKSKLVLLPYRWMGVRPPLSLIESMALGKCVITSRLKGNSEIIKDGCNGFSSDFLQFDKVTEKICFLLKDNQQRQIMGIAARNSIKEVYSPGEFDKFLNCYRADE